MKANVWEFSELGVGKKMDALPEAEKGEIDSKWAHLGQTKTFGTVEKVEELLNQRRFREAAGLREPPKTEAINANLTLTMPKLNIPKPRVIFSGIQPTGVPHLGNYVGALRQWVQLQHTEERDTKLIYSIVDLHAITMPQPPEQLRRRKREALAALLAIGIHPDRATLFHQSSVSGHSELMWILSCTASVGYLSRMTQWKSKLNLDQKSSIEDRQAGSRLKLGLFSYPVLQAADILVHRLSISNSPVNAQPTSTTPMATTSSPPQTLIPPVHRVMSLTDPTSKMSKSHKSDKSRILLTDAPQDIKVKIASAKTDSISGISYDPATRPGISNLLDILSIFDPEAREPSQLAAANSDISPKQLKDMVSDAVITGMGGIRDRYLDLVGKGDEYLDSIEAEGARKAQASADETMQIVRDAVGL
ncbi:hypothetical protein NM208_g8221 [Fusarium decemcellulare]|uniref:Uncharacterized protein n=1 Tax=Fusarium decemcellulare TaxID=57161 RepID=A0ACC1S682_9HYPO|nr:hypothetical protein NM208_g8221 [Fusarium decemcellulare]